MSSNHLNSSSAFTANRLTSTVFLIKEIDDLYSEHPHIYVKVVPSADTVLIIDTGCGGASDHPARISSLREFIEIVDVGDNGGRPLNPKGLMHYLIVLTHCHYDHILGVDQFPDSTVLASSHSPSFISTENIAEHSLCNNLKIEVPRYTPKLVPHQTEIYGCDAAKTPLGLTLLHTPGHTPDEIAVYDSSEGMLYVGDSLYEDEHIIFPKEGSIVEWFRSVDRLVNLVRTENLADRSKEVLINAGHCTAIRPAIEVLQAAKAFMTDVVEGVERVRKRTTKRGEKTVEYRQDCGRFSLICPERLIKEAEVEFEIKQGHV